MLTTLDSLSQKTLLCSISEIECRELKGSEKKKGTERIAASRLLPQSESFWMHLTDFYQLVSKCLLAALFMDFMI